MSLLVGPVAGAPRAEEAAGGARRSETTRLVAVYGVRPDRRERPTHASNWNRSPISWSIWQALRRTPVFEDVGVWAPHPDVELDGDGGIRLSVIEASSSLLDILEVRAEHGRLLVPREDVEPSRSVLLSYRAWRRHFGRRGDITGRAVRLRLPTSPFGDGELLEVVGVLAAGARVPGDPDLIRPVGRNPVEATSFSGFAVARLTRDASVAEASTVVNRFVASLEPLGDQRGVVVPVDVD
jgi:hypothetical protein